MKLKILKKIVPERLIEHAIGDLNIEICNVHMDSRTVGRGDLFIAIQGKQVDGHSYVERAIENGAVAVLANELPQQLADGITYIKCQDTREGLGYIAAEFYDQPSRSLKLVGVTGTNGKTTIALLLYQLYKSLGYKVGLISTIENRIDEKIVPAKYTTPFPLELNALLREMVENECAYVFMEVSSHAVDQKRILGLHYCGGVFTNITRDHLEYHKDFLSYIHAKKTFFDSLDSTAFAITNSDDKNGDVMVQSTRARCFKYSLKELVAYKGKLISHDLTGMEIKINQHVLHSRLTGRFNAYNLLAIFATVDLLSGVDTEVLIKLSNLFPAKGRFQLIHGENKKITGIVDYAHTPHALENVLKTIVEVKGKRQLVSVVGCGGDRDKGKRPMMAKIAVKFSDHVIFTSDNPRSEEPGEIIEEMMKGLSPKERLPVLRVEDRSNAIKTAVYLAKENAVILVAGKGHENYQEIKGKKIPFDDMKILKALLLEDF